MTRFWHRRICEATMFVSLMVVGLYFLPYAVVPGFVSGLFFVSESSLILSATTFTIAFISYLWTPRTRISLLTFAVYALLVVTTANLVLNTGETSSPFIALWIAVAVFAGVFGARGYVLLLGATVAYMAYTFLNQQPAQTLIVAAVAGLTPLIASFIIWHTKSSKDAEHDRAYNELATELTHEANKSDAVVNAINDGVVSIDKQGVIQVINPAAQRIIGWKGNDAVGLSYKSVIKLNDRADQPVSISSDPIERVLASNKEVESEDYSVVSETGKKVLLSMVISPIGQPSTGVIIVMRDLTKEKAEEREQAEFISTASHEMRTPVASIEGYLGLVLNPATATIDAKAREYIIKAQASAQHLGRLFQDLLDVSKTEDGRITNNPSVVDVVEFVADVTEGLKPKATEKGLRFLYKPRPGDRAPNERQMAPVFYVNVDDDHLREVIANLIENAIKYTPAGDIIVDVAGDDQHVTISVQDSGIGIPADDISHLFQKFYRVDNSDTREIGGTGLGLFLCRRLTEIMGGQIRLESEYKKGSTFFVDLPRIDHLEAQRLMEAATIAKDMIETSQAQAVSEIEPPTKEVVAPPPTAPQQLQPQPVPLQPVHPNVPLSQIEQNPGAYTNSRAPIQIPVRGPSEPNQP